MGPIVEELPSANDRRQWRILHPSDGTIAAYVGESITPDRALFCWRCGDIGCGHAQIVRAHVDEGKDSESDTPR